MEPELSPRQREVAELVAAGLRQTEIAERLHLSRSAVAWYVVRVADRLPGPGLPTAKIIRWTATHQQLSP
jgi:DNA-binding CsgD family transcriptional regulator